MAYFYKQKFSLSELAESPKLPARVMIFEPNYYLADLYRLYLHSQAYFVKHANDFDVLPYEIKSFQPDLLIFSADEPRAKFFLQQLSRNFSTLKVITIAYNLNQESVSGLMALGVISHINRRFSRPKDIVAVVQTFI